MVQSKCELVQMCKCVFVQLCQCVVVQRKVIKVSEIRDVVAGGVALLIRLSPPNQVIQRGNTKHLEWLINQIRISLVIISYLWCQIDKEKRRKSAISSAKHCLVRNLSIPRIVSICPTLRCDVATFDWKRPPNVEWKQGYVIRPFLTSSQRRT